MAAGTLIKFGIYELDLDTGELLKDGTRLHIQEQPLKVLRVLLDHPGELVTREQLKQAIAPDSTFGDFDHALNVAVAKLRTVLNDPAEHPVYIETLHKRGYRFIAPMSGCNPTPPVPVAPVVDAIHTTRRDLIWWAVAGIALVLVAAAIALGLWPRPQPIHQAVAFTTLEGDLGLPDLSPDGKEVAFAWLGVTGSPRRIYVQAIDSVVARALIDDPDPNRIEQGPTWFPDGSAILYLRSAPGVSGELWTVPRTGGVPHKLLAVEGTVRLGFGFDVAPDGKSIVTAEERDKGVIALYVVSLTDMSRRQLTYPVKKPWGLAGAYPSGDVVPRISPDGTSVAFLRRQESGADLYVVSINGGEPERLSTDLTPTTERMPAFAWEPKGKSLIVNAVQPKTGTVRSWWRFWPARRRWDPISISVGGNDSEIYNVALSADGRQLIFLQRSGIDNIFRFELPRSGHAGTEPVNVTQSTSANGSPQLSPDGKRLAFASSRSGHWEIYVANSDGSQLFQLTHFKGRAAGSSVWAPDGKQIAFDYRPGEHSQIYVIEANGGPERQMTFSDTDAVLPTYSRDGRWLYFARMRKDGMDVWKLPASGGTPALAVREAFCVEESVDGALLYYTKATDREMAIYSRPVDGGQEILLFREAGDITGSQNSFVVVDDGIYYRRRFPGRPAELMFYSFVHQRSDVVLPLPGIAIRTRISVSSDRTSLLATKRKTQDNIMLVENFR